MLLQLSRSYFNSIKVRLKLSAFYMRICTYYHFNSIKVRLKRLLWSSFPQWFVFQFHKGTIKTRKTGHHPHHYDAFQFHKGTIKTAMFVKSDYQPAPFQFHKGTIKTVDNYANNMAIRISIP